jgi:chromosome partitioning protein
MIIAVVSRKGGVGKTTTAVSVAALVGEAGFRVLLVDLDPQGNATSGLGVDRRGLEACIYRALTGDRPLRDIVVPTRWPGLDLAPATLELAGLEVELAARSDGAGWRERRLREALAPVREQYELVLIDAPPSLGLLTVNALVAADSVLIPVQTEYYALEGLSQLLNTVQFVQRRLNPRLELAGVALTMYDHRTNLARQVADEVRGFFGERAFEHIVPRNVRLSEAPSYGEPIHVYAPNSAGAEAYAGLAVELGERCGLEVAAVGAGEVSR